MGTRTMSLVDAQTEMILREHNPVNVMHDTGGKSAIQCLCDWTWRDPMRHAHHVAGALRSEVSGHPEEGK
jgi:hypothetical protein